jgi:hypothetical protein
MFITRCFIILSFCNVVAAHELDLNQCMKIEDSQSRLSCFESLANQERIKDIEVNNPNEQNLAGKTNNDDKSKTNRSAVQEKQDSSYLEDFGKKAESTKQQQSFVARINSISQSPAGHRIVVLSNGQTWSENEPGKIRIEANQEVTITQKRLRFVMRLSNGRVIAVRRQN